MTIDTTLMAVSDSRTTYTSPIADIVFPSEIHSDGTPRSLTVNANDITFQGAVGNSSKLNALTLTAEGAISAGDYAIFVNALDVTKSTSFISSYIRTDTGTGQDVGGNVLIRSSGDVNTGDIFTYSANTGQGKIDIVSTGGAITVGAVDTHGVGSASGSLIHLVADATVSVGNLITSAGDRTDTGDGFSAGAITVSGTSVTVGGLTADGGNAYAEDSSAHVGGAAGAVTLAAADSVAYSVVVAGEISAAGGSGVNGGSNAVLGDVAIDLNGVDAAVAGTLYLGNNTATSLNIDNFFNANVIVTGGAGTDGVYGPSLSNSHTLHWGINVNGGATTVAVDSNSATVTLSGVERIAGYNSLDEFVVSGAGDVTQIQGASGDNNVLGPNVNTYWYTTDTDVGYMATAADDSAAKYLDFLGIDTLTGGTADDHFSLATNSSAVFQGVVDGGGAATVAGDNVFLEGNSSGADNLVTVQVVDVNTAQVAPTSNIVRVARIEAIENNANSGNILSAVSGSNSWQITGDNDGTLNAAMRFIDFAHLIGGAGEDSFFVVAGGRVKTLLGGDGMDSLTAGDESNNWQISGAASTQATPYTVDLNGIDVGYVEKLYGSDSADAANRDQFTFSNGASGSNYYFTNDNNATNDGVIDARGGIYDVVNVTGDADVELGSNLFGVFNAEIISGDDTGWLTVAGQVDAGDASVYNTNALVWVVSDFDDTGVLADGFNDGTVAQAADSTNGFDAASVKFIGFAALQGSDTLADQFSIASGARLDGVASGVTIDGGSGAHSNTLTLESAADVVWTLLTGASAEGQVVYSVPAPTSHTNTFDNIQVITGGGAGTHSLIARNQNNYWQLPATGAQGSVVGFTDNNGNDIYDSDSDNTLTDSIAFNGFSALTGGNAIDVFDFATITAVSIAGDSDPVTSTDVLILNTTDANFWSISSDGSGRVNAGSIAATPAISFDRIESIVAPDGYVDIFELNSAVFPVSLEIDAGTATGITDSLTYASSVEDALQLTVSASGSYGGISGIESIVGNGVAGSTITANSAVDSNVAWSLANTENFVTADGVKTIFSGFTHVVGGDGNDDFVVVDNGFVRNIDAGLGANALTAPNGGAIFKLTSAGNTLTDADGTVTFIDSFTLVRSFAAYSSDTTDAYELNASGYGQALSVDLAAQSGSTFYTNGISKITADANFVGANTFAAADRDNTWSISEANTGTVDGIAFENFGNLTGGAADDSFQLGVNGSVSVNIDGGGFDTADSTAKGDVIEGKESAAWWVVDGTATGFVNSTDPATRVTSGDIVGRFSAITGLKGGTAADTFVVLDGGSISGAVGGSGAARDTLDYSRVASNTVSVTLGAGSGYGRFSDIEHYEGNGTDSTLAIKSGEGAIEGDITWALGLIANTTADGVDDGSVTYAYTENGTAVTPTITFENFNHLTGGESSDDNFTLDGSARVTGSLSGGSGGSDTITGPAAGSHFVVEQGGNRIQVTENDTTRRVHSFSGIEKLSGSDGTDTFSIGSGLFRGDVAGGGAIDTLSITSAADSTVSWNITNENKGSVSGINFSDIESLTGDNGNDTFTLATDGSVTGTVTGGSGNDTITGPAAGSYFVVGTGARYVRESTEETNTARRMNSFTGIEVLTGGLGADVFGIDFGSFANGSVNGAGGVNELRLVSASDTTVDWMVSAENVGTVNTVAFAGVENLVGGDGDDVFTLSANGSRITGSMDGGEGSDTLTGPNNGSYFVVEQGVDAVERYVQRSQANTVRRVESFTNIETLAGGTGTDVFRMDDGLLTNTAVQGGNGASDDTLIIDSDSDTAVDWAITGFDFGTVNSMGYSQIEKLTGTEGNDTFTLSNNGQVSGVINGGNGTNTIAGPTAGSYFVIEQDAMAVSRYIEISDTNSTRRVNSFDDIHVLKGGTGVDVFNIDNGLFSGEVFGGSAADKLVIESSTNTNVAWSITGNNSGSVGTIDYTGVESLTGGAGNDIYTLDSDGRVSGVVDGAMGSDQLIGPDVTSYYLLSSTVDQALGETVNEIRIGSASGSTKRVSHFKGIEILTGGSEADDFTVERAAVAVIEGAGGADVFKLATAGIGLTFRGGTSLEDDASDSLETTYTENTTWNIGSSQSLRRTSSGGSTVYLNGINSITGGDGVDTFTISSNAVGRLSGGGNQDIFTINSSNLSDIHIAGGIGSRDEIAIGYTDAGSRWTVDVDVDVDGNTLGTGGNNIYFSTVEILRGSEATAYADTFTIETAFSGDIYGRAGADTFNINAAVSGTLDGGTGGDTFNLNSSVQNGIADSWDVLGNSGADTFNLQGLNVIARIAGGSDDDTLNGFSGPSTWVVFNDSATSNITSDTLNTTGDVDFTSIENLNGGADVDDTFVINDLNATTNLTINAGAGSAGVDTLDFSQLTNVSEIDVATNLGGVANVERIKDDGDLILTSSLAAIFNVYDFDGDQGSVADNVNDGTIIVNSKTLQFINFSALKGSADSDSFNFNGGTLSGGIDGGSAGTDTITRAARYSSGGDLLEESNTTWVISGNNIGSLNDLGGFFRNVDVLQGNDGDDTFQVGAGATWVGSGMKFMGGSGTDTLASGKSASDWHVRSAGGGYVTYAKTDSLPNPPTWLTEFAGIEILNGSAAADTFISLLKG